MYKLVGEYPRIRVSHTCEEAARAGFKPPRYAVAVRFTNRASQGWLQKEAGAKIPLLSAVMDINY